MYFLKRPSYSSLKPFNCLKFSGLIILGSSFTSLIPAVLRICLTNSICWGILGVVFVRYLHPFIEEIVLTIDKTLLYYIVSIITIVLTVDFISTVVRVKNIKVTL